MAEKTEAKKVSRIKVKRKLWFKIISPKIFGNKEVGESYLTSAENALGRKLKVNLRDLTGNVKDQNAYVGLQATAVEGNLLKTSLISYELAVSYLKRMIKKSTLRLEEVFTAKTLGGKPVIIKTVLVPLRKTQRSLQTRLKQELRKELEAEVKKADFSTLISNLANRKIVNELRSKLKKIYPLREVAVRMALLKESGLVKEEVVVENKTAKAEKKAEVKADPKESAETKAGKEAEIKKKETAEDQPGQAAAEKP